MIPRLAAALVLAAFTTALPSGAQSTPKQFRARLAIVPIDLTMRKAVSGSGSAAARLEGSTLAVEGTFKDLVTPATVARVHRGPNRGLRGPAIGELQVETATSGAIRGTLTLTADQVEDLQKGRLYVQLHSEKAPDGNLWGWLLPDVRTEK
jgi:hypothetical protein